MPLIDLFAAHAGNLGRNYRIQHKPLEAINSKPNEGKRKRGRPKLTDNQRLIEVMDKPSAFVNYDTNHRSLTNYQYLNKRIFSDPSTGRPYMVAVICYDTKSNEPIAYRRHLNDLPADPFDDFPFRMKGDLGIENLVRDYELNNHTHPNTDDDNVKWPTNELEMLNLQKQHLNWGLIIQQLELLWTQQPEPLEPNDRIVRLNADQTVKLQEQEDKIAGALRMYDTRSTCPHGRAINQNLYVAAPSLCATTNTGTPLLHEPQLLCESTTIGIIWTKT